MFGHVQQPSSTDQGIHDQDTKSFYNKLACNRFNVFLQKHMISQCNQDESQFPSDHHQIEVVKARIAVMNKNPASFKA